MKFMKMSFVKDFMNKWYVEHSLAQGDSVF